MDFIYLIDIISILVCIPIYYLYIYICVCLALASIFDIINLIQTILSQLQKYVLFGFLLPLCKVEEGFPRCIMINTVWCFISHAIKSRASGRPSLQCSRMGLRQAFFFFYLHCSCTEAAGAAIVSWLSKRS